MGATRRPGNRRILASLSAAAVLAAGAAEAQVPQPIITKVVTADTQLLVYWDGPGSEQLLRYELGIRAGLGEWDDSHSADFGNHRFVGLENGTTYTIRVRSVFPSGTSDWTTSDPVTPAAPSQPPGQVTLRGVRVGQAAADVLFRGVDHAARYTVEWLPEEQWMAEMETWTSAQQRSLGVLITFGVTIGGLRPGTTYRARIRAENSVGNGPWNEFSFTTAAPPPPPPPDDGVGPPAPPRNLQATGEDRAVSLAWRAPVDDGGARIVRYEYRQQEGDGPVGEWRVIREDPPPTDHTVTGLTNGTAYTFELRAVNNGGWASAPSEPASATPEPEPEPLEVDIAGVPDVAVAGASYELTARSAEASLVYSWRIAYGGSIEPDDEKVVMWTAPATAGVAWIRVDVTREDGATAGRSAYVRVEAPDQASLTLRAAPAPAEGGEPVTVTAMFDKPAPATGLTVKLTTGGTATLDTDYTLSSSTVIVGAGETAGTVTITVTDDAEDDDGETIVLAAESTIPALTADPLTLTIEDNDVTPVPALPRQGAVWLGLLLTVLGAARLRGGIAPAPMCRQYNQSQA